MSCESLYRPGHLQQAAVFLLLCVGLMPFASTALAQEGSFLLTGSMNNSRHFHTATLLNDGKVLVAGGSTLNAPMASAELYDPATGTFTPTGSMNDPHSSHTATLLNNGKVLITGGLNILVSIASAELYDPATGTFTLTGSMNTPRKGHTATLLNNGKVLIAGGYDVSSPNYSATAELYDPATGTFTLTSSMSTPRGDHTATFLNNGKVLIAGGFDVNVPITSAELYDPTTGTFALTGSINNTRAWHTATLLNNGKVLVAGGYTSNTLASAELYDPATGTFTLTGTMSTPRADHTATFLNNGKVLIAGGFAWESAVLASTEMYDPATETFTLTGSMSTPRKDHTATFLNNGTVLVAGGTAGGANYPIASAELYDLVVVSPPTLSFSNQGILTTSASQTTTLTNNRSTAFSITSMAISGPNASDFTDTDVNCLGSVTAGASCSINVTFTPTAIGNRTGSLRIANDYGSPMPVPLTGIGVTATRIVSLSANSLPFANQMVGLVSSAQGITLNNTGNSTLTLSGFSFSGTNASEFAESDNCVGSVAAGASCTINVTFSPTAMGTRTGTLNIADNATGPPSPQTVAVAGTGTQPAPIVTLSSTSIIFPNQAINTSSTPRMVTLHNAGSAVLNIQTVALAGVNSGDFSIAGSSTCTNGATIAANASCVIPLTFMPTGLGTRSATMDISDNAADSPETISLSGTTTPTPLVSVTPSNITFPAQYVGTSGLPQSVTVTNNGDTSLSVTGITASPGDFGVLSACGSTVAAGASCVVGLFFAPTTSGARPGTLIINDNALGGPQTVPLGGTGQDFSMAPSSSATATVSPGQTASYTVSVAPSGGFNQVVALSCSGAPSLSSCSVSPASITLSGSASTVTVTVITAGTSAALTQPMGRPPVGGMLALLWIALPSTLALAMFVSLAGSHRKRSPRLLCRLAFLSLLSVGVTMSACGGGSKSTSAAPGTPVGTYNLKVTGGFTSGSTTLVHGAKLTLVVQ